MKPWLAAIVACIATSASATPISYDVHSTVGAATVDGVVITDGRLGVLAADDFLSFALTLRLGATVGTIDSSDGAIVNVGGAGTVATSSSLSFAYPATKDGTFLRFTGPLDRVSVWCLGGICSQFPIPGEFVFLPGETASVLRPSVTEVLGIAPQVVPEPSTVLLLAAALLAAGSVVGTRRGAGRIVETRG